MTKVVVSSPPINFRPISFADLEGWAEDDHALAFAAFLRSCEADPELPHAVPALALGVQAGNREAARAFFEERFAPHVSTQSASAGFVTGYYEPEIEGSYARGGPFQVPVYRRPPDLVTLAPETDRARYNDRVTGFRQTAQGQVPYHTRAEIWNGALEGRGLELLYVKDMVELFYMQVQGSGRVHLAEGGAVRLTYDGKNGYPYTSIGRLLIERGAIAPGAMSMAAVKHWLSADSVRGRALMEENRSYVFFRELGAEEGSSGPRGAQGVALTPGRSLAVDTEYHRLGLPVFVTAPGLAAEGQPFRRLMIAQDVGSAIRGPERGDIFWGTGEDAGAIAGSTRHEARFVVLLAKR
ncbi:MAG: murein transglycosylase A [Methyloceanibacter sp.]